ncbi:MAG: MFS transporter [Euryarchaeota archaeon]|nr:MFS transporter [Euryarchaeota archaeon]
MVNIKASMMKGVGINIIILGFVSLFTDLSSQMVFPLIPLFLSTTLGASPIVVGLVEGCAETTASLLKVFSGYWSDRIKKRKPFVFIGYGLSGLMKPLFAFSYVWQSVLVIRIAERIGKGIRNAPRDAIVAESCDTGVMGKAYGIHRAMDGFGSILGVVMALILLFFLDIRDIFLLAGIPAIIAVLLVLFIKEKKKDVPVKSVASIRISFKALTPELKKFIIISTIFTLGHFGYAFLLLRALDIGQDITNTLVMYILFYLIYTIFTIPAGIISDKFGRKPVIISGYLLFGLTSIGLSLTSDLFWTVSLFMLYGLFFAMIDGVQRAFVVDLTPPELKATALGTFHAATGLAALPAGLIAGLLWEFFSPETTFFYSFIVSIIAAVLLLLWSKSPCEFKSV